MAKTFQTDVILKLVDHLAGPLTRTARSVERSTGIITRSFRALDRAGGRLAVGFAGAAGLTRAAETLGRQMVEISKLQNKINAASVSIEEAAGKSMVKFLSDADKKANLNSAIENAAKYNLTVQSFLKAQDELVRAGNSPQAARAASQMAGVLAKFSEMDAGKVAEQMTSLMVDFKMPRGTAAQVEQTAKSMANILAFAETAAPGKIADLFESFRFAGSMLASTGTDFKTSTAILIGLAKANVKGSEAGVALRSMLVSLVRPTKKGTEALDKLGLSYKDFVTQTTMSGKSLGEAMAKYSKGDSLDPMFPGFDPGSHEKQLDAIAKTKDIIQRQKALTDFIKQNLPSAANMDSDAIATVVNENLAMAGTKVDLMKFFKTALEKGIPAEALVRIFEGRQFNRINLAIQHAMEAAALANKGIPDDLMDKMFGETMKGLAGSVSALESSWSRFAAKLEQSQLGKDMETVIRGLASAINSLSDAFGNFDPDTQRWVAVGAAVLTLVGLTAPIIALAKGFGLLARNMAAASAAGAALGAGGAAAGGAAAAAGGAAGGAGAAAAAGGAAGGVAAFLARLTAVGAAMTAIYAVLKPIRDANEERFKGVAPGEVHNRGRDQMRRNNEQRRLEYQRQTEELRNRVEQQSQPPGNKGSMGYDLLNKLKGTSGEANAGAKAMDNQASSADALAAKGATIEAFSGTVSSAMQSITAQVNSAAAAFSGLIGKISGAAGAASQLNKAAPMSAPGGGANGASAAKPMGSTASPHSPGPGSGRSSTGGITRVAVDVTSSDGSVNVKSASTSGSGGVAVTSRGRRMSGVA